MALGKYGPIALTFRPVDAEVYDAHGTRVPTYTDSTGTTAAAPSIDSRGRVYFWVEAGTYDLLLTAAGGSGTVTQSITVSPSGTDEVDPNAASGALTSASKIAQFVTLNSGQTVPFGGSGTVLDMTAFTVQRGADYWGIPGSALDLAVTLTGNGQIDYPDFDTAYELEANVTLLTDGADVGKLVGIQLRGNDTDHYMWAPVEPDGAGAGFAELRVYVSDRTFLTDGVDPPGHVLVRILPHLLTANATVQRAAVTITQPA